MKLWTGRLDGEVDARVNALNASISFDSRMIEQDIRGSMAHAKMLESIGVLTSGELAAIQEGLSAILSQVQAGTLPIDPEAEDVHTFVEAELTSRIGQPGKKLHTARSRNDQVALDLRMYLLDGMEGLKEGIRNAALALCTIAREQLHTVMPGYTHMQRAQPVTLAHHLMAYVQMLLRDLDRIQDAGRRTASLPLGGGALAGTTYPLDRAMVAEELGFLSVGENSMDCVSDRDFCVELTADLAMVMMHLSRLSEELILWSSWEFRFVTLSDRFSTGSSIMPQKKNPDIPELIRGKTGRVYGDLNCLLTMLKGLPLAYNKDMQEDKEAVFDAMDTVLACLEILPDMLKTAVFQKENMLKAASRGFINATDLADYLVKKGMPFRDAYKVSGTLVNRCIALDCTLETLPLQEYRAQSLLFAEDVYPAIDLLTCVENRNVFGGPAPKQVLGQIERAEAKLNP
jgi:argininosuccinate lyase